MRSRLAILVVALGLVAQSAPSLALAQDTAQARIEAAASALDAVQTIRFTGESNVTPDSTGETIKVFAGNGEFQAPDRAHMTIEQPLQSQVNETISVSGQTWLRTVDGSAWVPVGGASGTPGPSTFADQLRQVSKYIISPSVTSGNQVVISGDLDLAQAVADESEIPGMVGLGFGGDSSQQAQVNGAKATITLDPSSGYMTALNTTLSMVPGETPDGFPPGGVTITTSLTLSDFNSPSISIDVPGQ